MQGWLEIHKGVVLGGKRGGRRDMKGGKWRVVHIGGGGGKHVFMAVTSSMSSTLRGSTCTEFHRLTRCIRGVMVTTRSGVKSYYGSYPSLLRGI